MSWWDYPSKLAALVYVEYIEVIHVEVKLGSRLGTKETRSLYIVCLIKVPIFGWVYFLGVFLETWIVDCKCHKMPLVSYWFMEISSSLRDLTSTTFCLNTEEELSYSNILLIIYIFFLYVLTVFFFFLLSIWKNKE